MSPLRILIAHCRYQQPGGEDRVVAAEAELLARHGHTVEFYERDNHDISGMGHLNIASHTVWSAKSSREIRALCAQFRPDVIHVHNTFPLISPSIYWAAHDLKVPVIQTLHNFRLVCPQATLLREGRICEDCVGKFPWPAIIHRCYRGSAAASGTIALMLGIHRALGSFRDKVARYIATSRFYADRFVVGGIPANKISVKPHFVDLPALPGRQRCGGLYVGRLSSEKGIKTLMEALRLLPARNFTVIGDGPERAHVTAPVSFVGWQEPSQVYERMRSAEYIVIPSICYESGPLALIEAFACGLPVIASRLGPMAELIEDGKTGWLFDPGFSTSLAEKLRWAGANPEQMRKMGENARAEYEARYTPEKNYRQLINIYKNSITVEACETQSAARSVY
ncbi:MAG: glycosyltransferase family 4 protein [Pyrinomonadaceae bacterium]